MLLQDMGAGEKAMEVGQGENSSLPSEMKAFKSPMVGLNPTFLTAKTASAKSPPLGSY